MSLQIAEYSRLTTEIDSYASTVTKTATIAFSLYMAIIWYGVTAKSGIIIALSFLPAILAVILICELYSAMDRTSSYIKEVYEGVKNDIYWETRLQEKRSKQGYKSQRNTVMKIFLTIMYFVSIAVSAYFFSRFEYSETEIVSFYIYLSLLIGASIGYILGMKYIILRRKDYDSWKTYWKNIFENENTTL